MKYYEATIPLKLPDLNTYNTISRSPKSGLYMANTLKQETQFAIMMYLPELKTNPVYPLDLHCNWCCKTSKRDPDNIAFAVKFILDALVKKGILANDNMRYIRSISHHFKLSDTDSVTIILEGKEIKNEQ